MNVSDSTGIPLLDVAVDHLSRLPGIGKRTALRLALHLLRDEPEVAEGLGQSIIDMRREVRHCKCCHNISATDLCPICSDSHRDRATICVVENINDVITIEATHSFHGLYHVLGGLISPIDGIGPSDIEAESLVQRVRECGVEEVILALSPTLEGDTTAYYIFRHLQSTPVKIVTTLARGISVGTDLGMTDALTLGRSLTGRIPYSK